MIKPRTFFRRRRNARNELMKSMQIILLFSFLLALMSVGHAQQAQTSLKTDNLTFADRNEWRKILRWSEDCEESFNNDEETRAGLTFWSVTKDKVLVEVQCAITYQGVQMYFVYNKTSKASQPLDFKIYEQNSSGKVAPKIETIIAGFPDFNQQTKILTIETKFRGGADCGSLAKYQINSEGKAELKEFRAKYECDGRETLPENYPRIFPL